jgi:hypothetical protein
VKHGSWQLRGNTLELVWNWQNLQDKVVLSSWERIPHTEAFASKGHKAGWEAVLVPKSD